MSDKTKKEIYWSKVSLFGKIMYYTGSIRYYYNGDGLGMVWRYWHPLAWVFIPVLFILLGFLEGFPRTWERKSDMGIGLDPYFEKNPEKLEWF